jgi:hypothetical protein
MKSSKCLKFFGFLCFAVVGTFYIGISHASDWMDVRLGLPPLQFEQSGEIQRSYLQTLSHSSDIQTYAGAAGDDEPLDLEALSKQMDNPLGSLWLLFVQNDMIRISDDFPLKRNDPRSRSLKPPSRTWIRRAREDSLLWALGGQDRNSMMSKTGSAPIISLS